LASLLLWPVLALTPLLLTPFLLLLILQLGLLFCAFAWHVILPIYFLPTNPCSYKNAGQTIGQKM
jgi:hypothetical protein